ncbi:hypothetical protein HMPREF2693_00245 [Staphylococcus sp. HMSC068D08]|uniref:hypothetical protein n=1 Tax=Staphylococcus TaxID=1279 RepID=UPI0008A59A5F|nr:MULTISPECIES: hypothetical protein [Staphylococcus]MCI2750587.1 hypothetical protein [Staphylococcus lugdunensis]MCI2753642.1 hypothetical protein [Staphylococcus lugdunensis]MCI2756633.1 hypothetical protein [Staphylococcus lugdunensis]MCI2782157.1 hypothetical protein [Staphylococcus lugdunensis]MCI2797524.1 hypothetical protein [Staphylococcus lugdunensis]
MTNQLDTLIALSKEYTRLLEKRREIEPNIFSYEPKIPTSRIKRTGIVLRQTMIDYENGRVK